MWKSQSSNSFAQVKHNRADFVQQRFWNNVTFCMHELSSALSSHVSYLSFNQTDVAIDSFQHQKMHVKRVWGKLTATPMWAVFPLHQKVGMRVCRLVRHMSVLRKLCLSIIQSNAICQTVSLGPQRDAGRVEIRHIALPSGWFLLLPPHSRVLDLWVCWCVTEWAHWELYVDENHALLFFLWRNLFGV